MRVEILLFVQEGCPPCYEVKDNLSKVDGWDKVITLVDLTESRDNSLLAEKCGVPGTPVMVAVENGEVVAKVEGSGKMTTELFQKTIDAFKNGDLD